MKASKVIKELQKRIAVYGDFEVVMRANDNGIDQEDFDAISVYGDEDAEKIVISDYLY